MGMQQRNIREGIHGVGGAAPHNVNVTDLDTLVTRNAKPHHLEALIRRSNAVLLPGVIRGNDYDHIDGARVTKEPSDS
jgi:hypothetical protein